MWQLPILLLAFASFGASQNVNNLECSFGMLYGYTCTLNGVEHVNREDSVEISGTHLDNMNNDDVESVIVINSNTPFIIEELFEVFPNINYLQVTTSHLQSIRIPETANLRSFYALLNNITRIDADSFRGQTNLESLTLYSNMITEIDDAAFDDLINVRTAAFVNNQIRDLNERTLSRLFSAQTIDFERNQLTRIDENVFANNAGLQRLYLEFNHINEVSPTFINELRQTNINYLNFAGNECSSFGVNIDPDFGFGILAAAFQRCFLLFAGVGPDDRRQLRLEYVGNLGIVDQFGNELLNV